MKTFNNHFLFSHLYLDELTESEKGTEGAKKLISSLGGWYSGWDDSSLESILSTIVEPTLVSLDFNYQRCSGNDQFVELKSSSEQEEPLGICYVVSPDEDDNLDSTVKGRHYVADLIHALKEEKLIWGLLTDGKHWRLYNTEELAPYETYFEVDLKAVLEGGDSSQDAGILFHELFRKEAFLEDDEGECELDCRQKLSEEATERIEEHLSDCIEELMRDLCQGFVEKDERQQYSEEQRDEIFSDATILLYRMLFVLFAEARGLLPVGDLAYDPVSLSSLVDQAIDYTKESGLEDPEGTSLWQALSDLSAWINSGDEAHHIPSYNGDLFEDEDKPYIHDFTIADKYLAPALFSLGTIEADNEKGYRRIDYRDLAVRHLGSIYEGLLEYKLFIAREKRVRRADGKGGYSFPVVAQTTLKKGEEDNVIDVDEVYFAHNAGERKAIGAYYTPEYIVDYIVENTVRRGVDERRESLEEKLPQWIAEVEASPPGERSRLQRTVDQRLLEFVEEEVLTFSVCDPAMGSGHFLVNAAHQITNFIVETLNLTSWENKEVNSDPVYWRRRVVKSCIYGVDLNELAVELAKLSLWLTAIERGKPLGFLDHHLRPGNSLIGVRLDDLTELLYEPTAKEKKIKEAGQLTMYDAAPEFSRMFTELQEKLDRISSMVAENPEEVKFQEVAYQEIREELKPLREMGDAIVARHFGAGIDDATIQKVLHVGSDLIFDQVARISEEHHFFHWDLEFFDVLLKSQESEENIKHGFNAVIGNPPWDMLIDFEGRPNLEEETDYYDSTTHYSPFIKGGRKNIYWYFCILGTTILEDNGYFSMITPSTILTDKTTRGIRRLFIVENSLQQIVQFPETANVFEDVTQSCSIFLISNNIDRNSKFKLALNIKTAQLNNIKFRIINKEVIIKATGDMFAIPMILNEATPTILDKLHTWPDLKVIADVYQGEANLTFDSGHFKEEPTDARLIRGKHIQKYYLKSPTNGEFDWISGEKFLESTSRSTRLKIAKERVATQQVANMSLKDRLKAMIVSPGDVVGNSCNVLVKRETQQSSLFYMLALLNSTLLEFRFKTFSSNNHISTYELESLPMRKISFSTPDNTKNQGNQQLIESFEKHLLKNNISQENILDIIDSHLLPIGKNKNEKQKEKADIIHDFLSYLANEIILLNERNKYLERNIDIFDYIEKDMDITTTGDAFKFAKNKLVSGDADLGNVRHDIDGLRLIKGGKNAWLVEVLIKYRDPNLGWKEFIKEKGSNRIKREWITAYELDIDEQEAMFYQYVFERLEGFENVGSFPGGYTRTTFEKLQKTKIPVYQDVDLSELQQLDNEFKETERTIELTDSLIDKIVYKLYDLTEEEIAIVEDWTKNK